MFSPSPNLPPLIQGTPTVSKGTTITLPILNQREEPFILQPGWALGALEAVKLVQPPLDASPPELPPSPPHLTPQQSHDLQALLQEFSDVFSKGDHDLGQTHLLEHEIHTEGPPVRLPQRRQNPAVRKEEAHQIGEMLQHDVIRPSTSPWASPVVMVRKKDGALRFCVDFRKVNSATIKDAQPLARVDDLLDSLRGAQWFSTLDLKSGYWQVPIKEQDRQKTAFRTSGGRLFEFNKVPFGLTNAPATFSRLMDKVLVGLAWETCLYYLDDVIVFSKTWAEHLQRLRQVFERLRGAQLKLSPKKCHLGQEEVLYLGHQVSRGGLRPDPALLSAIQGIHPPQTVTQVRSFLGLTSYYRRFVKGFATIAAPLHALTKKRRPFSLDYRVPPGLPNPEGRPHVTPCHSLPRLRCPLPPLHGRFHHRAGGHPGPETGKPRKNHLLCLTGIE